MPKVTVAEIRAELTEAQNVKYLDYQIEWWIAHKKHKKADVLKTIGNQVINETRALTVLQDPTYRAHIFDELNRYSNANYHILFETFIHMQF